MLLAFTFIHADLWADTNTKRDEQENKLGSFVFNDIERMCVLEDFTFNDLGVDGMGIRLN